MSEIEKKLTLEEAMERLEAISQTMEKENLPLDEMMRLYKEGKELDKTCRALLDQADKEVQILRTEGEE